MVISLYGNSVSEGDEEQEEDLLLPPPPLTVPRSAMICMHVETEGRTMLALKVRRRLPSGQHF